MHSGLVQPGLLWDFIWQSTLFLPAGIIGSYLLRNQPARAHRLLLLAVMASVTAPLATSAVRAAGWGVLPSSADAAPGQRDDRGQASGRLAGPATGPAHGVVDAQRDERLAARSSSTAPREWLRSIDWRSAATFLWLLVSAALVVRLVFSLRDGRRLMERAEGLQDLGIMSSLRAAAAQLGLRTDVELRLSNAVRCPAIWSWGPRPAVVLPRSLAGDQAVDWESLFCHELGHLKRRDHLVALLIEILTCVAPWQLALWWARRRLTELSERACDMWALDGRGSPTRYAETLLRLAPQSRGMHALPAVSSRRHLTRRVVSLLADERGSPRAGAAWSAAAVLATACIIGTVACVQPERAAATVHGLTTKLGTNTDTGREEIRIELPGLAESATPLDMVLIPGGTFTMGSSVNVFGEPDEKEWPPHQVTISKPFYIGKYELTQAQWEAITGEKLDSRHFTLGPNYPAAKMSWSRANASIRRLNRMGMGTFRLPTEAEWEYAARGGADSLYYFGTDPENMNRHMWWKGNYTSGGHHEVGQKLPNGWGLYDMHGNVSEWCSDVWEDPYAGRSHQTDPQGPHPRPFAHPFTKRVFRGIAFKFTAIPEWRFTSRHREQQADFHYTLGMRLVKEHP